MTLTIDSRRWTDGLQDAYAGRSSKTGAADDHSYASGRVEGEALRQKHREEYEQALFDGRRVRPVPKAVP